VANPVSSVDVPLSLFSGWNTELSPPDQPEGASPANNDVAFTPGAVSTRPGLNRVFVSPIDSLGPISYQKSFVTTSGIIQNLYFADGILWVENLATNPGVAVSLFNSAGATYASSCTAQGREYIMLSDGVHGVDIPLQYDGINLYRVTQDGPAQSPIVQSVPLPPSSLAVSIGSAYTITSAAGIDPYVLGGATYYQQLKLNLAVPTAVLAPGQSVAYLSSDYNISGQIVTVQYTGTLVSSFTMFYFGTTGGPDTGGTATVGGSTLVRSGNTVTATTATPHGMQKGYQAQISGVPIFYLDLNIVSIVLDNEETPGIATVTTDEPHGLLPTNIISMTGVTGSNVGGGITNVAFAGGLVTITTATAHGLSVGSQVLVEAVTNTTVNGQWSVVTTPLPNTFTYAFNSIITAYSASDTGTVNYEWPLASTDPALNYFTVQTAPTPNSFTIQLSYTDGTWADGLIGFAWDGIFFVTAILSPTQFQYQQYGPAAATTDDGTVTPYGQASPGIHQLQMSWLFESGDISFPSPTVTFVANGGQYLQLSQIPVPTTGDVVGRILQFTGAAGAYFFYIPTPAQVNGLVVSTATQINDVTTTSILLDFSDNTLYSATAVSKPGNNLANLLTLGSSSGVFTYASRLIVWGFRNKVQNLLNMGFAGGTSSAISDGQPLGWNTTSSVNGLVSPCRLQIGTANDLCAGYQVRVINNGAKYGQISQSAYADSYGAPIVLPNTNYSLRLWMATTVADASLNFYATLSSVSTSFTSTAVINGVNMPLGSGGNPIGGYVQVPFSTVMPSPIPSDMTLTFWLTSTSATSSITVLYNETELIYTDEPFIDNEEWISYADNLSSFDEDTGIFGPEDDLSPIRNHGVIRQSLYIVTGSGLHETEDNGQTEPSGWTIDQVADNCGAFSIASVARNSQGIGSAGKDWMMWSGPDGAQIFTGQKPYKISQEIQSVWDAIPAANQYQCWVKNYENAKWCFFGIPTGSTMQVLVLDYRNIDGEAIASNPPIHISFTGKMIVSDLTRKWTSWTIPAYCGELMYRGTLAQPQIVFGCKTLLNAANSYILNANQYHDDDFGVIPASYTTYFFVSHEMEQALQVGSHRHVYTLAQAYISGLGTWTITPLAASLINPFPTSSAYPLTSEPNFDMDFGINVETTRCAFTIKSSPTSGDDSWFKLQKLVINMAKAPWAPSRGSAGGSF
jgi:hypothetical protein